MSLLSRLKPVVRDTVVGLASHAQLTTPHRRHADHLVVATFHRVLPAALRDQYPLPGLSVTPEELDWFLVRFREAYTCGPLDECFRRWRAGERPAKPLLAITFDDAQQDNWDHAREVLARRGICASFYVPVGHADSGEPLWHDRLGFAAQQALTADRRAALSKALDVDDDDPSLAEDRAWVAHVVRSAKDLPPTERRARIEVAERAAGGTSVPPWAGLMSWDALRKLAADGHEIGCHTFTHPLLPQCTDSEIEREVIDAKAALEERMDQSVTTFCYPNGDHDARSVAAARRAGYACAVTTRWGSNPRGTDLYRLQRCDMNAQHVRDRHGALDSARLRWRMSGLQRIAS